MAVVTPIPGKLWIRRNRKKIFQPFYGPERTHRLKLYNLPLGEIVPETFIQQPAFEVEVILCLLKFGTWIDEDWRPYARYAIANRLHNRSAIIFQPPFDQIKATLLEYQLEGGKIATRNSLRAFASKILTRPLKASAYERATSRLILSITDDLEENACMQPFHWIRAVLATSDPVAMFGLALAKSEMKRQKVTLCKMLRATLP